MQLRLQPASKSAFPIKALLIRGESIFYWIQEIQSIGLRLNEINVFPLPNTSPNSIWGCIVLFENKALIQDIRHHIYCQAVNDLLFIPENTIVFPQILPQELDKLLLSKKYLLHHEIGMVALEETIDWKAHLNLPPKIEKITKMPADTVFIPSEIRNFQIQELDPQKVLEEMEQMYAQTQLEDRPLTAIEKAKLAFYKKMFGEEKDNSNANTWAKKINTMFDKVFGEGRGEAAFFKKAKEDYEALQKRNQEQIDKLMDLLKSNPKEALKYAIPLDEKGAWRGDKSENYRFDLQKRWDNFSFDFSAKNRLSNGGSSVMPDEHFRKLQAEYERVAQDLVKKKEYREAAFVYLRLLKNYIMAAKTLEDGKLYSEAALVYLKYVKDNKKAAESYEKANMIKDAIELYKKIEEYEKVGDLYRQLRNFNESNAFYQKVVDKYVDSRQYVKASFLYKDKMEMLQEAQDLLLKGWQNNLDAFNCLNNYFNNIQDKKTLYQEIQRIYEMNANQKNYLVFFQAIKYEYQKHYENPEISTLTRDLAYEIIVEEAKRSPNILSELTSFNKKDKEFLKDLLRYKIVKK